MAGDRPVLAGRSPIKLELIHAVVRVLLGVLLPVRVALVDAVGGIKIFLLERVEETVDDFFLRVIAGQVLVDGNGDRQHDDGRDNAFTALGRSRIVFLSIHQCHARFLKACV